MSQKFIYHTNVQWKGEHLGRIFMGNGPEMELSAPPDATGLPNMLTPEDAFVGAVNGCIMLMFLWACERLKIDLITYECRAEGTKLIELDKTEIFSEIKLYPQIRVKAEDELKENLEKRVQNALRSAKKYSLVANSIKSEITIEPTITVS